MQTNNELTKKKYKWIRDITVAVSTIALVFSAVGMSVWIGSMAFMTTGSKAVGAMVSLQTYLICVATRSWVKTSLEKFFDTLQNNSKVSKHSYDPTQPCPTQTGVLSPRRPPKQ